MGPGPGGVSRTGPGPWGGPRSRVCSTGSDGPQAAAVTRAAWAARGPSAAGLGRGESRGDQEPRKDRHPTSDGGQCSLCSGRPVESPGQGPALEPLSAGLPGVREAVPPGRGVHRGVPRTRTRPARWGSFSLVRGKLGLGARCGRAEESQGPRLSCAARPPGNWGATAAAFRQPNHNPSLCPGLDASPPASTHELTIPNDVSMPSPPPARPPPAFGRRSPSCPTGKEPLGIQDSGLGVQAPELAGCPGPPLSPGEGAAPVRVAWECSGADLPRAPGLCGVCVLWGAVARCLGSRAWHAWRPVSAQLRGGLKAPPTLSSSHRPLNPRTTPRALTPEIGTSGRWGPRVRQGQRPRHGEAFPAPAWPEASSCP